MTEIITSLDGVRGEMTQGGGSGKGDDEYIRKNGLWLRGGDISLIRFLTDGDSLGRARYHAVKQMFPSGKSFDKQILCTRSEGNCDQCARGVRSSLKLFFWVYVYHVLRGKQNFALANDPDAEVWKKVKRGTKQYYKEEVNAPRLLVTGPGKGLYVLGAFTTYFNKFETLLDRDYEWSREGSGRDDTAYTLIPDEVRDVPFQKVELPTLEDVIRGNVEREQQQEVVDEEEPETSYQKEDFNDEEGLW